MSAQTGIAPGLLADLDGDMFDALTDALEQRWTPELELAASLLETASAHLLLTARVHAKKGARLPPPVQVPRPGSTRPAERRLTARRVSIAELAAMTGAGEPPAPRGR